MQALTFWEQKGKGRLQLAKKLGISDRSLARWAAGERTPDLENAAKTFFHLYAEGCFDDLSQAIDLAWLMGLTPNPSRSSCGASLSSRSMPRFASSWIGFSRSRPLKVR